MGVSNKMEKKIIIQIFTGGYKEEKVTYEQISEKLLPILDTGAIKRVIIGWSLRKSLYRDTIKLLKSYGVECFLWLPVFSETGMIKSVKRLLDDRSYEVENYSLKEGENFEFYCPQNHQNIQRFLEIYEENFSDLDFDGVFVNTVSSMLMKQTVEPKAAFFLNKLAMLFPNPLS